MTGQAQQGICMQEPDSCMHMLTCREGSAGAVLASQPAEVHVRHASASKVIAHLEE